MIAIKGMDMPKSCNNCRLCVIVTTINDLDILCGINSDIDTVSGFTNSRHPKCKLIALPEENKDMSFGELKEKCKSLKDIEFSSDGFDFEYKGIWFNKIGTIIYGNQRIENKKSYEMYQIIKALTGDER